ncbi:unnamed protein product [Paramecium pentaurelia]|uniref:Uncharacterized protein n=1 Tax=Paramecium pentaurelia TaxID=43138 RepID=A0A8S1XMV6_9CILI|nr:unnamed protein product [Paramecium pentaurelia]
MLHIHFSDQYIEGNIFGKILKHYQGLSLILPRDIEIFSRAEKIKSQILYFEKKKMGEIYTTNQSRKHLILIKMVIKMFNYLSRGVTCKALIWQIKFFNKIKLVCMHKMKFSLNCIKAIKDSNKFGNQMKILDEII